MILRVLIFLVIFSSGCRTLKKVSSSTETLTEKSDQNSSKFNREVITEYVVDTLWRTRFDTLYRTMKVPDYRVVEKPYIIRQTIRESGETQQVKTEVAQVKEEVKDKEASIPKLMQYSILFIAIALFVIAVLMIIKQFK